MVCFKKSLKTPIHLSEAVNQMTDSTMANNYLQNIMQKTKDGATRTQMFQNGQQLLFHWWHFYVLFSIQIMYKMRHSEMSPCHV